MTTDRRSSRLDPSPIELIDRSKGIEFEFNGRPMHAYEGDTVGSALYASGVRIFSRSFKYHRVRGMLCVSGSCPNCLMTVDGVPNVRACVQRVETRDEGQGTERMARPRTRPILRHRPLSLGAARRILLQGSVQTEGAMELLGFPHPTDRRTGKRQSRCRGASIRASLVCPHRRCRRGGRYRGDVRSP